MGLINSVFNTNKPIRPYYLGALRVDMHSHLIPGIDDGSQSMDQTIGMLLRMVDLGYQKIITTPHVMFDYYRNNPETILGGLEAVRAEVKRLNIPIEIEAAAEYFYDEYFLKILETEKLLTFGDKELLFEFSFGAKPNNIDELIFKIKTNGYKPVLAHYERYIFFLEEGIEPAVKMREKGVKIQMNLNSLTGHYGPAIKKQAELMLDNGIVDYLGTDCHRIEHLDILEKNLDKKYFRKLRDLSFQNKNLL